MQDDLINSYEARLTELQSKNSTLQSSFQDSQKRLETAESRLSEVLEARAALRRKLETRDAEAAAMQASLQADIDVLKVRTLLSRRLQGIGSWLSLIACGDSCWAGWPASDCRCPQGGVLLPLLVNQQVDDCCGGLGMTAG